MRTLLLLACLLHSCLTRRLIYEERSDVTKRGSLASLLFAANRIPHFSKSNVGRARAPVMTFGRRSRPSARSSGLGLALKTGTRKAHSLAEKAEFNIAFFKGLSTRTAFAQLVSSLYFVYQTMEEEFDRAVNVNVRALDYPELRRSRSLEADMEYYFGHDWKTKVVASAATRRYCKRIKSVARDHPHLLVAHMYTRYIGDLFGGQIMRGMARTSLNLDEGKGTRFYEFDDIASIKEFIEAWYTKLNTLELSEQQKIEIVQEANNVFALNLGIFKEIGGTEANFLDELLQRFMNAGATFQAQLGRSFT